MLALMPLAADYRIEQRHLQAVIEGCQMDLEQTRYLDLQACSATATGGRHRGRGLARGIFGTDRAPPNTRTRPGLPAHQHHPRRG